MMGDLYMGRDFLPLVMKLSFQGLRAMRKKIHDFLNSGLGRLLCGITIIVSPPAAAGVLGEGRPELVAILQAEHDPHCSGLAVGADLVLTLRACAFEDGELRQDLTVLPGLNQTDQRGVGLTKPFDRRYVGRVITHDSIPDVVLIKIAQDGKSSLEASEYPMPPPDLYPSTIDVLHMTNSLRGVTAQAFDRCEAGEFSAAGVEINCAFGSESRGGVVIMNGFPVGLLSFEGSPDTLRPAYMSMDVHTFISDLSENPSNFTSFDLEPRPYATLDILNMCDQDVHQGVFWMDLGGEWRDLARRVPSGTHMRLPVASRADAFFSYARSDDGRFLWSGEDLQVRIKNVPLDMKRIAFPQPSGDATLVYECGE